MDSQTHYSVQFPRKEREVLGLLKDRLTLKEIGGLLEISVRTVRERLARSCERARLVDETEMMLFLIQHPHILEQGARCTPGLHLPVIRNRDDQAAEDEPLEPCSCGDPECLGPVAIVLKRA